jgi:hypothetical protein
MPVEQTPPRRLKTQVERIRDDAKKAGSSASTQKVTVETIEAILPNNQVTVLGVNIPVTGSGAGLASGGRIAVAWTDGKPTAAIFHHAQSAQFVPSLGATAGIVEELYIDDNDGKLDVFFRNATVKAGLGLRVPSTDGTPAQLSADPLEVFWGANPDTFCARTGADTYHVFKLKRTVDKVLVSAPHVDKKLYQVTLSTDVLPVDLVTVGIHELRNNIESYVKLNWSPPGVFGDPFAFSSCALTFDGQNVNNADVSRQVTIRLTGATTITFVNGSPIDASLIVVPAGSGSIATASLQGVMVDDNDELVYTAKVAFDHWGMWQGNSSVGLTGSYNLLGSGALVNAGVCFVDGCPHLLDNVGIQDFMGHGNPSGVIASSVSETHSVVIEARTATVRFSTFNNAIVTLEILETSAGANPYRIVDYTGMPVIANQCYEAALWSPKNNTFFTFPDQNVGLVGDVGMLKSERSLFSQIIPFAPDLPMGNDPTPASPTRCAVIRVNVPGSGYDREWTDTFGQVCGTFTGAGQSQVQVLWNANSVGVFDRYKVHVTAFPFWAKGGNLYIFFGVRRDAQNPIGYEADQSQFAAFVMVGGAVFTLMDYTSVPSTDTMFPTFMSGNGKRVLWRRGTDWFLSDFAGHSAQVGSNADADDAARMVLTENDFLYDTKETRRYFVKGWDRNTLAITLNQASADFPPKEGALSQIQGLKNVGTDVGGITLGSYASWINGTAGKRSYQSIMDKQLLPGAYKNL